MTRNIPASIKARLLNRAKLSREEFELFLVRYACERFLYRLGASPERDRCVLKGAGLLTLWTGDPYRATRDVDLLAHGSNDEVDVRSAMMTICKVPCPDDGLRFDVESLNVTPIRSEEKYSGQRAILNVYLDKARVRLQVDFAFGDVVTPGPEEASYPTLIDGLPAPFIRTYPRVAAVAEKFQAMVHLGRRNSRMKDFHDIWALSEEFSFDGAALSRAVLETFKRRETAWTSELPEVLETQFYARETLASLWSAYLRGGAFRTPPPGSFVDVGERVMSFLGPVRDAAVAEIRFAKNWSPGGAWR